MESHYSYTVYIPVSLSSTLESNQVMYSLLLQVINRFDAIEQRITVQFVKLHAHVPISTFKILRNYFYLLSENRTQLKSTGFQVPPLPSPPPSPPPVPLALRLPLPQLLPPGCYGGTDTLSASLLSRRAVRCGAVELF